MPQPHFYKHLDESDPRVRPQDNMTVTFNMHDLAHHVTSANYGLHRFLSVVIDIKRQSAYEEDHVLADKLERILLDGHD